MGLTPDLSKMDLSHIGDSFISILSIAIAVYLVHRLSASLVISKGKQEVAGSKKYLIWYTNQDL